MNDPRQATTLGDVTVEVFPVNDERALEAEVSQLDAAKEWSRLDVTQRDGMKLMVREALLRLADDVETWLPEAIVLRTGQRFGVFMLWKNRHLDEAVVRMRATAERDSEQRLADLKRIAGRRHEPDAPPG